MPDYSRDARAWPCRQSPPTPGTERKCLRCGSTRPIAEFTRAIQRGAPGENFWEVCNECRGQQVSMGREQFTRYFLQPAAHPQTRQTALRRCFWCRGRAPRPLRRFVRSATPHGPLEVSWRCNGCASRGRDMCWQEFAELFLQPREVLYTDREGRLRTCSRCEEPHTQEFFARTLSPSVLATSMPTVCNQCCIANGDLGDESVVEYPGTINLGFEIRRSCLACRKNLSQHWFVRSARAGGHAAYGWRSCNHCAMRRSLLTVEEFASLYHGP